LQAPRLNPETTKRDVKRAVDIITRCIPWLLASRDRKWAGKECLKVTCEKCTRNIVKPNCGFNTARAVMSLSRARNVWQHLREGDARKVSEAVIDGACHLLQCASKDRCFEPTETYYWWSSDITLGEHRIEVVRTTAATVLALIEFKRFIESGVQPKPIFQDEKDLERKIDGGVKWLCKTMVGASQSSKNPNFLLAEVMPTTSGGVSGYQAFVYHGSWINIPIHIHKSVRDYVSAKKDTIRSKLGLKDEEGEDKVENEFMEDLKQQTLNSYIEACRTMMSPDLVEYLVKAGIPRIFDVECTKDALMALAAYKREYEKNIPRVQHVMHCIEHAIDCIRKKRDQNGLWSELICMNFHTLVAVLLAEVESDDRMITDALKYLDKFELEEEPDICLLVSKTLVDFLKSEDLKLNAPVTLRKYIDEIYRLTRLPEAEDRILGEKMWCYEFEERKGCAVPQTSWAVYTLAILLEQLEEYLNQIKHEIRVFSRETSADKLKSYARLRDVGSIEDSIDRKLRAEGYTPTSRNLCGVVFHKVYEKLTSSGGLESHIIVEKFKALAKHKANERETNEFIDNVKQVKDPAKIKKVFLIISEQYPEDVVDLLKEAERDIGIEFDVEIARDEGV